MKNRSDKLHSDLRVWAMLAQFAALFAVIYLIENTFWGWEMVAVILIFADLAVADHIAFWIADRLVPLIEKFRPSSRNSR